MSQYCVSAKNFQSNSKIHKKSRKQHNRRNIVPQTKYHSNEFFNLKFTKEIYGIICFTSTAIYRHFNIFLVCLINPLYLCGFVQIKSVPYNCQICHDFYCWLQYFNRAFLPQRKWTRGFLTGTGTMQIMAWLKFRCNDKKREVCLEFQLNIDFMATTLQHMTCR